MERITVSPFVPGRVRGVIQHEPKTTRDDAILLVTQAQLDDISGTPAAIIIVDGAPFSHAVIRNLGRGIPVAMLEAEQVASLPEGTAVILDTEQNVITPASPGASFTPWDPAASTTCGVPYMTRDGQPVELCASVGNIGSAVCAVQSGATAIGALRSEYLLPAAGIEPDRAFYRHSLEQIMAAASPLPVTIRLLDFTPDKLQEWLPASTGANSMLGVRGMRLYETEAVYRALRAEMQAIDELATCYVLQLMLPSGSELTGFCRWRDELHAMLATRVPIGVMVETPAAALEIDRWLQHAEFVAIGCNDMMQCLFGAERELPAVRHLLDPYSPALFRFFRLMAETAGEDIHRIQLCGLLPQVRGVLPVLLGLGYRRFSGEPVLIPPLAGTVTNQSINACEALASQVCAAGDSTQVRHLLGVSQETTWGLATIPAPKASDSDSEQV
jgi:phosphoenolpyruvate-protein kinase (PTS system EI component)